MQSHPIFLNRQESGVLAKPPAKRVVDCTDREQLLPLGQRRFDCVVCTMALMDIGDIQPLAFAAARLLKIRGCFVLSLCHPCFNSGLTKDGVERYDFDGELVEDYFVRVSRHADNMTTKGLAMAGQPVPQYYFHRPLAMLLGTFFAEGFVLDRQEEPTFGANANGTSLFVRAYQRIPPALVDRLRLAGE